MIKIINLKNNNKYYIVGDIGGTNSRLAVYNNYGEQIFGKTYNNNLHRYCIKGGFYLICQEFFISWNEYSITNNFKLDKCCLAIAGNIYQGKVELNNKSIWGKIREKIVAHIFNIPVEFINDFIGSSYGVLLLDLEKDVEFIQGSIESIKKNSPKCLIGAGTGLGQSYLTCNSNEYVAYPSEGGHSNFSPQNNKEYELQTWLIEKYSKNTKFNRISKERVISGKGIVDIFKFLNGNNYECEQIDSNTISKNSKIYFLGKNDIFTETMKIFTNCYGNVTGNLALQFLPFGGLFIVGGIASKNIEWIKSPEFLNPLLNKGRLSNLIKNIPIILVNSVDAINKLGKNGAWYYAKNKM